MGKKKFYGDARVLNLDLFTTDTSDGNDFASSLRERELLASMYDDYDVAIPVKGQVVNAVFVGLSSDQFNFDAGFKDYIRVEAKPSEESYLKNTNIGDSVDVLVVDINQDNFFIKGSFVELYETIARRTLTSLEEGTAVIAFVREMTPAGYNIDIQFEGVSLPGFMPNTLAGINKLSKPESIVGKTFDVMIESFSRDEGTYIVSRRKYLQTLIPVALRELQHGQLYTGQVTGTTDFGVFVEFNECLTGMVHKTNITSEWSNRISQISPGVLIEFYIKEIIKDKIILTQILRETLWDSIKVGQVINGRVKDIKPFGALISLDDETNGLVHTSELEKSSHRPKSGDEIKVKVIAVDRSSRKIFLTLV